MMVQVMNSRFIMMEPPVLSKMLEQELSAQITNGSAIVFTKNESEDLAKFIADGAVELYHNGNKKFETGQWWYFGNWMTSCGK